MTAGHRSAQQPADVGLPQDFAIDLVAGLAGRAIGAVTSFGGVVASVGGAVLQPLLKTRWSAGHSADLSRRGHGYRAACQERMSQLLDMTIPAVVELVLDRLDLTAIVRDRVDLDSLVSTVDLDQIIARLDLVGLTEEIIEAIDLPKIIRESTGSVASETVRDVRMRGVTGDEAVARTVDRLLFRRQPRLAPREVTGRSDGSQENPGSPPTKEGTKEGEPPSMRRSERATGP